MSIPKILHYCWFGNKPLGRDTVRFIQGWKKLCPDYQIRRWDESNSPWKDSLYAQQAYQEKKWAFVSDYVRLKVLWEYGGIYLDTDVELKKSLDGFLDTACFIGFEEPYRLGSAVIGAEPKQAWIGELLADYEKKSFLKEDNMLDLTANTRIITQYLIKHEGLALNNTKQFLNNGLMVYSSDYFSPKSYDTGRFCSSEHTVAIHHFEGSWLSCFDKYKHRLGCILRRVYGVREK